MAPPRRAEISDTLRQRVLSALHFRTLDAGERLPSARALAAELDADPRVILAAYASLEREGVVERRPGARGFFVASARDDSGTLAPTAAWLVDVVTGALARGVHGPDFPELVRRALETMQLRAACIECNDDQMVWLTRELKEDYGVAATGISVDTLRASEVLPSAVRSADMLLTTAAHEAELRPIAERVGRPLIVVALRTDLVADIARLLARGPVYFVGTDPRFADKVRQRFDGVPGADQVRTVIVGRDDLDAIPVGSPAYVMRTAREALGGVPARLRPLSTLRAFAVESQRAILKLVVQANLGALRSRPGALT